MQVRDILITARPYQKEQDPHLHFLWRDVYFWLDEWLRDSCLTMHPTLTPTMPTSNLCAATF